MTALFFKHQFAVQLSLFTSYDMPERVHIEVEGAVSLAGFGSALCKTNEVFHENQHDSYRGRCLAVLRAKDSPGKATIIIKSAGVKPVTIEVEVK